MLDYSHYIYATVTDPIRLVFIITHRVHRWVRIVIVFLPLYFG